MTLDLSIYLVTDTGMCGEFGVPATVREAVAGGVTLVQVRDPDASDAQFLDLSKAVVAVCRGTGVPVLLNDRVHLVAAAGADGAHVGQGDMPVAEARALLGDDAILGLTADTPAEFEAALATGVRIDYVGIGPVYSQQTKLDIRGAFGPDHLAQLVALCPWPAVAIGGVKAENLAAVKATGVAGGSVVSAICGQPDPRAAAAELAAIWRQS